MARLITDLIGKHDGNKAVVMGGGMSLPAAVDSVAGDAIWISANQHGAKLLQDRGRRADYIYAADVFHQVMRLEGKKMHMAHLLRPFGAPIISKRWWPDFRIPTSMFPITGNSGLQAIGAAILLGCYPIIVAGIEMYRGAGTYFHEPGGKSSGLDRRDEDITAVVDECAAAVAGWPVRKIGCPLLPFPDYNPAETFTAPTMPPWALQIAQATAQEWRVRWSFRRHGEEFKGRDVILLTPQEAGEARMSPRLAPLNPAHAAQEPPKPPRLVGPLKSRQQHRALRDR